MSDSAALAAFYTELAEKDVLYDHALSVKTSDPETYGREMAEYAEWRRDVKILAARKGAAKALAIKNGEDLEWIDGRPEGVAENASVVVEEG